MQFPVCWWMFCGWMFCGWMSAAEVRVGGCLQPDTSRFNGHYNAGWLQRSEWKISTRERLSDPSDDSRVTRYRRGVEVVNRSWMVLCSRTDKKKNGTPNIVWRPLIYHGRPAQVYVWETRGSALASMGSSCR